MKGVRALGGLTLVFGAAAQHVLDSDPPDDENLVIKVDVALGVCVKVSVSRDPARLQRASEGAA